VLANGDCASVATVLVNGAIHGTLVEYVGTREIFETIILGAGVKTAEAVDQLDNQDENEERRRAGELIVCLRKLNVI
jgi:hypothetical protein